MLLEEFDPTYDAIINPEMIVSWIDHFPEATVSCFSKYLFGSVLSLLDAEKIVRSSYRRAQSRMREPAIIMQNRAIP